MEERGYIHHVRIGGPRPPFYTVAAHLWGSAVDFDSDGDARFPDDPAWTELTVIHRGAENERVDVDPVQEAPLVLQVAGTSEALAMRTARYLADATGGEIVAPPPFSE